MPNNPDKRARFLVCPRITRTNRKEENHSPFRVVSRVSWANPLIAERLLAHHRHHNFPAVRSAPMLEKEDTLPRA